VAPHIWGSALSFMAGLHLAFASPCATVLGFSLGANPLLRALVEQPIICDNGFISAPTRPRSAMLAFVLRPSFVGVRPSSFVHTPRRHPMLIKACLNGSRAPGTHPALPLTPTQLADAARDAVAAGAGALHIHPRRADGSQSFEPHDVAAAVTALRAACPGVPIGSTTAAWVEPDPARRLALVRSWTMRPDFVSVNFSEAGTEQLCAAVLQSGIGIEAGLSTAEDARLLIETRLAGRCVRLLIEPDEPETDAALVAVRAIEALLDGAGIRAPRLLHGSEATAWPLLDEALRCGYDTRIGFEDTLAMPDGSPARDNAQLVAVARERAARAARVDAHG